MVPELQTSRVRSPRNKGSQVTAATKTIRPAAATAAETMTMTYLVRLIDMTSSQSCLLSCHSADVYIHVIRAGCSPWPCPSLDPSRHFTPLCPLQLRWVALQQCRRCHLHETNVEVFAALRRWPRPAALHSTVSNDAMVRPSTCSMHVHAISSSHTTLR